MAISERLSGIDAVPPIETAASLFGSIKSLAQPCARWAHACVGYDQTAALYEQLNRLSNTELRNRGLSRHTLAWDISESMQYNC